MLNKGVWIAYFLFLMTGGSQQVINSLVIASNTDKEKQKSV